jgi:hypothetical protein
MSLAYCSSLAKEGRAAMPNETIVVVNPRERPQIELGSKRSSLTESGEPGDSDQFDRFEALTKQLVNTPKPKAD